MILVLKENESMSQDQTNALLAEIDKVRKSGHKLDVIILPKEIDFICIKEKISS